MKSIAILTPAIPERPMVFALSGVTPLGVLFGPLGAIADTKIQDERASDYQSALVRRPYSPQDVLRQDVEMQLRSKGFTVTAIDVQRGAPQFLSRYPAIAQSATDAFLDVVIVNYGYVAGAITAPYHPLVGLQYRLVRASDATVLMEGSFGYSNMGHDVEPDSAYDFPTFKDIMADTDRSIAGLNAGFALGAEAISKALE